MLNWYDNMTFFNWLAKKQQSVLGVDISSTSVKVVELELTPGGYKILEFGARGLPPDAVIENEIKDAEKTSATLQKVIASGNFKSTNAVIAVSGSAVITKIIQMAEHLSEDEMTSQIAIEADRYIPYPLEEVNMDFQVVGPSSTQNNMVDVVLAASRSENVTSRVDVLLMAGLEALVVDVEAYALERAFAEIVGKDAEKKTFAVLDIGATVTSLSVIHDTETVYTREQIFGGRQLTDEIKRRYGMTFEEAGMSKRKGGLPPDYETEVLAPFKAAIIQQVSRGLQFFFSASEFDIIDKIFLAGGTARLPNMTEDITQRIGIETVVANPFSTMAMAEHINRERLYSEAPSYMLACGLAMRGLVNDSSD